MSLMLSLDYQVFSVGPGGTDLNSGWVSGWAWNKNKAIKLAQKKLSKVIKLRKVKNLRTYRTIVWKNYKEKGFFVVMIHFDHDGVGAPHSPEEELWIASFPRRSNTEL